ncbi:uncharacterized protein MAM_08041 [Metarhizium album ARSEF 1941]|uniref:Uncharacterized protein n=1 Tax=Metarhizium album (strain ARSEF 1941) TaxID=1081103 RepID=A0A0B2WE12_METAS|nr:uncharacterized protein MAM_08041 [Metarhizium album ARSEF 1941]KHN94111.1 hypothetical protein MAM_08041 [Metarhizium album ARSEF 1941]
MVRLGIVALACAATSCMALSASRQVPDGAGSLTQDGSQVAGIENAAEARRKFIEAALQAALEVAEMLNQMKDTGA